MTKVILPPNSDGSGSAQPALVAGGDQKGAGVLGDGLVITGESGIEVGNDVVGGALAVTALQDFGSSRIELDQAFRVQQDVRLLAGFVAEQVVRAKARAGGWVHGVDARSEGAAAVAGDRPGARSANVDVGGHFEAEADFAVSRGLPVHRMSP